VLPSITAGEHEFFSRKKKTGNGDYVFYTMFHPWVDLSGKVLHISNEGKKIYFQA
jgi:hypothetical protein